MFLVFMASCNNISHAPVKYEKITNGVDMSLNRNKSHPDLDKVAAVTVKVTCQG